MYAPFLSAVTGCLVTNVPHPSLVGTHNEFLGVADVVNDIHEVLLSPGQICANWKLGSTSLPLS